jgi:hypothetical protein
LRLNRHKSSVFGVSENPLCHNRPLSGADLRLNRHKSSVFGVSENPLMADQSDPADQDVKHGTALAKMSSWG